MITLEQTQPIMDTEDNTANDKIKVVLVNGNRIQTEFIQSFFDPDKFDIKAFIDGNEAFEFLARNEDLSIVVVISYQLKNMNGLEIMQEIKEIGKEYAFVFLTADKTVERAIEAMKAGAIDFIPKTGNLEADLIPLVEKAYSCQQTRLEQKRIKRELDEKNRELAKLSIVAQKTNNAVAIYDERLILKWVNESFIRFYGYTKKEYTDQFGHKITDSIDDSYIIKQIQICVNQKTAITYSYQHKIKTGETLWVQRTLSPVLDDEGNISKLVSVDSDITELKKAEERIRRQKKNITDSINYARKIQKSILPDTDSLKKYAKDAFMFYQPKDVVSGDFPWLFKHNGVYYVAAVDCTGHGVPGALLSLVGVFNLVNIVDHDRVLSSGEILDMLNSYVMRTLRQNKEGSKTRDGMDIALCKIDTQNQVIQFSGAHRPLYMLHDKKLLTFDGDKRAIGGNPLRDTLRRRKLERLKKKGVYNENEAEKDERFGTQTINYKKGDRIFMFSDGLPDQFKDNSQEKYSNERIRNIIESNRKKSMDDLYHLFNDDFNNWKGNSTQLDDVLLIGLEL
jgi:PAS domain S-box-containing protein